MRHKHSCVQLFAWPTGSIGRPSDGHRADQRPVIDLKRDHAPLPTRELCYDTIHAFLSVSYPISAWRHNGFRIRPQSLCLFYFNCYVNNLSKWHETCHVQKGNILSININYAST